MTAVTETPRDRVVRLLDELAAGGTADSVAAKLDALGIRGFPADPCACPVYEYLAPIDERVRVAETLIGLPGAKLIALPDVIAEFIDDFDAGMYPGLVLDGGDE